jgi:hypothetical protein
MAQVVPIVIGFDDVTAPDGTDVPMRVCNDAQPVRSGKECSTSA